MFIPNPSQMLIKFLLISALSCACFGQFINKKWKEYQLITPKKQILKISWAVSMNEKMHGLSGLKPEAMKKEQGLLFYYKHDDIRSFWMPYTFFDLDIIFLDKDFKVIGIEHGVKHFPKYEPQAKIPVTKSYKCRYVLELKSGVAKEVGIKINSKLKWKNTREVLSFLHSLEK